MLLELKDVSVHYGKAQAVDSVSLAVEEGSIVTIVGANGAGKTTIIRTISGILRASAGDIYFDGKRITKTSPSEIVRMGLVQVPAGRRIFGPMTVMDNLLSGAYLRRDKAGIREDLEKMYAYFPILKERSSQAGGSLSGGEQQMLAVARALMAKPRLLLMDEPSVGLSPIMVAEVGKVIQDIRQMGISVLLVEQNSRMALKLASKAYVLELGRIVREGDAKELAADPQIKKYYLGGG